MAEKVKKAAGTGARDIGLDKEPPATSCKDNNCPWHGELPVRGTVLSGTVVSAKMQGTVVVEGARATAVSTGIGRIIAAPTEKRNRDNR